MATQKSSGTTTMAFAAVTVLFFAWGFITSMVDPLVGAVKGIFTLTDFEAQAAAFAFFIAYGVASFPAAALLARIKSIPTIMVALSMMIAGCLVMLLATNLAVFVLVLVGLFILASGITILQVAANPLAAALGDPSRSHLRLTFSQTFNSVGTVLGPIIGAELFLKGLNVKHGAVVTDAVRNASLAGIDTAYFWFAGLIAALAVFFFLVRGVVTAAVPPVAATDGRSIGTLARGAFFSPRGLIGLAALAAFAVAWGMGILGANAKLFGGLAITLYLFTILGLELKSKWALIGAYAIFLYVGAEVSIGTQMALFLNHDSIWGQSDALFSIPFVDYVVPRDNVVGLSLEQAGKATALYWGGAMVGRAIGSALLAKVRASALLAVFTAIAAAMCLYVFGVGGVTAGFVALAIGLFNSIMFPVIFTLTLERSSAGEAATSGLLCTAIIGGAFLPLLVGKISDAHGYAFALILPAICYGVLCVIAIAAGKARVLRTEGEMASIH